MITAPATIVRSRHIVVVGLGVRADLRQRLHRVGQRQHVADRLQPAGHLLARHEQPAQQQLRHDHHRQELYGLELGAGEGAAEQPERHARGPR